MRTIWTIIVIIILAIIGYFVYAAVSGPGSAATTSGTATTTSPGDADAASTTVATFGQQLGMVSTLAATSTAASNIAQYYGPYVDPTLLAQWEANPSLAPGHTTSSPSPDHIDIVSVASNGDGTYTVNGNVIETLQTGTASATPSGSFPITATVANENGSWLITAWSGYPATQAQ